MLKSLITRLIREEEAASATEYAILVAAIAGAVYVAVQNFNIQTIFTTVSTKVTGCVTATGATC